MVQALIIRNNGSSEDAKDIFQEAMIVLYEKAGNFRWHALTESLFKETNSYDVYPQYFVIKVNDTEETFIKKTKGDIVYVVDDPK